MPRTVTIRVSVAVGLLLLVAGGGVFAYGAYEGAGVATERGLHLEAVDDTTADQPPAVSELPLDQRAVVLLTLDSAETRFTTSSAALRATVTDLPATVRFEGTSYRVTTFVIDSTAGSGL